MRDLPNLQSGIIDACDCVLADAIYSISIENMKLIHRSAWATTEIMITKKIVKNNPNIYIVYRHEAG